ncbi:MAG: hypothetical protein LBN33_05330 [Desulfovibrio sp.]|jgi:hypothetical protein|nr:hypothetical protein [Desulfovibrio sp.]
MPNDAATLPDFARMQAEDTDEEIVDLLEVVKPGKNVPRSGAGDDADFTEDLESMLDNLSETENAPPVSGVKNFPDPTPVDYHVDHNESLDLPDMDELDDILQSLEPDDQKALSKTPDTDSTLEEIQSELEDLPDPDAVPVPEIMGDKDMTKPPQKAAPAAAPVAAPVDPFEAAGAIAAAALQQTGSGSGEVPEILIDTEGLEDILAGANAPATPEKALGEDSAPASPADPDQADFGMENDPYGGEESTSDPWQDNLSDADMGASSLGEVDLVELDALLDDMLSSAPASGPGPANTSAFQSGAAAEDTSGGQPASAPSASEGGGNPGADDAEKLKEIPGLMEDLRALRGDLEGGKADLSSLEGRLSRLEDEFADLHANLDKIAAATAARVIREELAALLAQ